LSEGKGVDRVFEGLGTQVLAIFENEYREIGVLTVFAQAEEKVQIFGGGKGGVVPAEVLGEK